MQVGSDTSHLAIIFAKKIIMTPLGKYIWLIKLLQEKDGMTFEEINEKWLEFRKNKDDKNIPILKRTFHNHINAIREEYGIHIECGPGYRYYIDDSEKDVNPIVGRLSVLNLLNESVSDSKLSKSILIDEYLDLFRDNVTMIIMDAIKTRHKIKLDHLMFSSVPKSNIRELVVIPYQLHYICSQWFLLGYTEEFGLMRFPLNFYFGDVQMTDDLYKNPSDYSPEEYNKLIYGTTNERVLVTIQLMNLFPKRISLSRFPLMPFQQKIEFGNWDKEGKDNNSSQVFYNTRITFNLPKTPFALYALQRRIGAYSHVVLNDTDPFAFFTEDQYLDAIGKPIVLK